MDKYYVYQHRDPRNGDIVYVGKGVHGRAWDVTRARSSNHAHSAWMIELSDLGYLPNEWVEILTKGLSEIEAYRIERELVWKLGETLFNGQIGEKSFRAKLTNDQAREIYLSPENSGDLSRKYGVSRAAIQHIKTGKQWRAATACFRN